MKRLITFSCIVLASVMLWAEEAEIADFRILCKDGTVTYFSGANTEMTFDESAAVLYVSVDNSVISYAVDGIESVDFAPGGTYRGKYSYAGNHVKVSVDPADDTLFTVVPEDVITDDTDPDYGDFIENYTPKNTVVITYNGDKVTYSGNPSGVNVIASGAHVIVTSAKKNIAYTLKGTTTNGSFKLYSEKKAQVTLAGISITNPTGAAVNIQSGKTMLIKLADGTTNKLTDGTSYTLEGEEQQKGAFFSEGQLIFSGQGTLDVKSNYGHGIASDDYVRVRSGNITINSVRDGISTKDRFVMYGGELDINARQDGIDVGDGYIEIGGGTIVVNAGDEGITASYEGEDDGSVDPLITPYIDIRGGLLKVTTTGDKGHGIRAMSTLTMSGGIVQATVKGAGSKALLSEGDMSLTGGKVTAICEGGALYETETGDLSSAAGIRSKGALTVENMTVGVKSTGSGGKGINNVGDVVMNNSSITVLATGASYKQGSLTSLSYGVDTDGSLTLDGGSLQVKSCSKPLHVKGVQTFRSEAVYNGYQIGE